VNLLDLKKREFKRSEFWQYMSLGGSFLIYAIGVVTGFFDSNAKLVKFLAIASVAIQFFSFLFRHLSAVHADLGGEINRRNNFAHGLDIQPSREEVEDWHIRVGTVKPGGMDNEHYFDTETEEPSPKKLLELTRVSAYFTTNIAGRAAIAFGSISAVGFFFFVYLLIILVQAGVTATNLERINRVVIASMGFWASGELAWLALCYYRLSQTARRNRDRCAEALGRSGKIDLAEAMVIVGEYNCATAQCPTLPELIYNRLKSDLNIALESTKQSSDEIGLKKNLSGD